MADERIPFATHAESTVLGADEIILNMGPQHPSTHGVLRVKLRLDGEKVIGSECVIGYLHRGVEKIAEHRTYTQFAPYVDRMDYVAAVSNGLGYCEAVEKLLGTEAPLRARVIRTILTELQRIASHLFWLGTHALDIGALTPLFYCLREREEILKIFEKYCGARLTTHAFRIGGLQYEAYDEFEKDVERFCKPFDTRVDEYESLLTGNRIWVGRTKGIGILTAKEAIDYAASGPVIRASGVKWDIRKAMPYAAYDLYKFEIPVGKNGDTFDRYIVRMEEMRQSRLICLQAIENIPAGPIMGKVGKVLKPPPGEVYHAIEAPKGELGYYIVSDGTTQPYRVRIRPPSLINLEAFDKMIRGHLVADVVAIIGTLDIVLEKSTANAMQNAIDFVISIWVPLVCALVIVGVLPLVTGYIVLMERKVMADMQARLGPMRVGPHGLLQPIADAVKLLIKEDIIPDEADKVIFWIAPLISVTAGMLAISPLAIGPWFQIADLNVGILFVVGIGALGLFGIVLGGWSSNSHYSLLGALRSAAQLVSYETAAGMAIVGALLLAGTLSTREIIAAQDDYGTWFIFAAPVGFFIYVVASIAETNRAPFDLPEAESELVAGYMTEYSGFRWALYFLAEYTNMVVVASIATTLFLGGWLRPFAGTAAFNFLDYIPSLLMLGVGGYCFYRAPKQPVQVQKMFMIGVGLAIILVAIILAAPLLATEGSMLASAKAGLHGAFWFLLKVGLYIYLFMWLRFTFPRYRFDQLMRLGWQFLIPLSIVNVMGIGLALVLHRQWGWGHIPAFGLTTLLTLAAAGWLGWAGEKKDKEHVFVGET